MKTILGFGGEGWLVFPTLKRCFVFVFFWLVLLLLLKGRLTFFFHGFVFFLSKNLFLVGSPTFLTRYLGPKQIWFGIFLKETDGLTQWN